MDEVVGERQGVVLLLTLSRPTRLNALNKALLLCLDDWMARAAADDEVRAVVITGAGDRAFSAGADIGELGGPGGAEALPFMRLGQLVFNRIAELPKPVLAAVNGYALGGGCELAMACDMRFASEEVRFGQPEITLANIPGWGGTQRLPQLVGPARAKELIFSGEPITAAEAYRIGLVNRLYPKTELLTKTVEYAALLAQRAPLALALAKQAIQASWPTGLTAGLSQEALSASLCCGTPDQRETVARFLAKRAEKASLRS